MTKNTKKLLGLVGALAVLGGAYGTIVLINQHNEEKKAEQSKAEKEANTFYLSQMEEPVSISYTNSYGTFAFSYDTENETWSYDSDEHFPVTQSYLTSIHLLTFITFPLLVAIGVFSTPIVKILYSDQFADSSIIITLLSLAYLPLSVSNPVGSLTVALGRTDTSFYYTIARLVLSLPVVIFTSSISLVCLAYGQILLGVVGFFLIYFMMISRYLHISLITYLDSFLKNLCVVLTFGLICSIVIHFNPFDIESNYLTLLIYGSIFFVLYAIIVIYFYRNDIVLSQVILQFSRKK